MSLSKARRRKDEEVWIGGLAMLAALKRASVRSTSQMVVALNKNRIGSSAVDGLTGSKARVEGRGCLLMKIGDGGKGGQ